jgi:hypothetical protein
MLTKMVRASFWAIFSSAHLVTMSASNVFKWNGWKQKSGPKSKNERSTKLGLNASFRVSHFSRLLNSFLKPFTLQEVFLENVRKSRIAPF